MKNNCPSWRVAVNSTTQSENKDNCKDLQAIIFCMQCITLSYFTFTPAPQTLDIGIV